MANIKSINASGHLPFDCYQDQRFAHWLAFIASPVSGIRLTWGKEVGSRPSKEGGKTAMYAFHLYGEEAIRWPALNDLKALIEELGEVREWDVVDIEGEG